MMYHDRAANKIRAMSTDDKQPEDKEEDENDLLVGKKERAHQMFLTKTPIKFVFPRCASCCAKICGCCQHDNKSKVIQETEFDKFIDQYLRDKGLLEEENT